MKALDYVIGFQGSYYLITSVWPLINFESFEAVVGPKPDRFQFFTTALLILIIAVSLLLSVGRQKTRAIKLLALGTPIVFIVVEMWFRESIRSVFMLEAILEAGILLTLSYLFFKKSL